MHRFDHEFMAQFMHRVALDEARATHGSNHVRVAEYGTERRRSLIWDHLIGFRRWEPGS